MDRIKANQIANGYLSEGIDEGINPEYFLANEAQANIDELVDMLQEIVNQYGGFNTGAHIRMVANELIAKHKGE